MSTEIAERTPLQALVARVRGPEFLEQVKVALPGNVRPERFQRAVITAVMQNPEVVVDPGSLFQSALRAAQDGLIPDGREAAFVVVKEKGEKKVAYWPMIGGYRKIAAKHGITLVADVVRENDSWAWSKMPPAVMHSPPLRDRGEIVCAYAAAFDKDWRFVAAPIVMDIEEIEKVRAVSRAADSEYGPWVKWWERMAVKTVARRLFHELPLGDLEEVDARIVEAASQDADLSPTNGLTHDEANIIAALANGTPPADRGPDDTAPEVAASPPPTDDPPLDGRDPRGDDNQQPDAAGTSGAAQAAPAAPAPGEPEDGEWEEALPGLSPLVEAAGAQTIPSGNFKGKTLAEMGATEEGRRWLLTQLRRLAADDRMRPAIETYVEGALPDIWERYQA